MKSRRSFLLGMLAGLPLAIFSRVLRAGQPTPPETEGPFYPLYPQKDKDFDLTQVAGRSGVAKGRVIIIQGQVLDTEGRAIEDATVELWQANAAGRYRHPSDRNTAPLDPNFQGWAIVQSGRQGRFHFIIVMHSKGSFRSGTRKGVSIASAEIQYQRLITIQTGLKSGCKFRR